MKAGPEQGNLRRGTVDGWQQYAREEAEVQPMSGTRDSFGAAEEDSEPDGGIVKLVGDSALDRKTMSHTRIVYIIVNIP